MKCRYRGCVALAIDKPNYTCCAVHATGQGVPCTACSGTGTTTMRLGGTPDTCDQCGGVGIVDRRRQLAKARRRARVPVDQRGLIVRAQEED